VRVGLAISDRDRRIASPLATYTRRSPELDAEYFRQVVQSEGVVGIVLGLPVHLNGREGQKAIEARQFGAWLTETTSLPVVFCDERFTTGEAEAALWGAGLTHKKRRARRDSVAAVLLLQSYLEAECPKEPEIKALDE